MHSVLELIEFLKNQNQRQRLAQHEKDKIIAKSPALVLQNWSQLLHFNLSFIDGQDWSTQDLVWLLLLGLSLT